MKYEHPYPRRCEKWSPPEDERLMLMVRRSKKKVDWNAIAKALKRTNAGVQTRYHTIKAGIEYNNWINRR